jgi:hypothetical protein
MKYDLDAGDRLGYEFAVAQISTNQLDRSAEVAEILIFSGAEIIQHPYMVAVADESFT